MIFVVTKDLSKIEKFQPESFVNLNIWERKHIEEWVRKSPDILGEELLIVSVEFDRFDTSSDRLDLLAVDRSGNLVVIELKRDSFAGYADLQSIRYAAMVSVMTIDKLLPYFVDYLKEVCGEEGVTEEDAQGKIMDFVEEEEFEDFNVRPRIILCSEDFSQEVTSTVLWLRQFGVDISCVKITPYPMGDNIIIVPNRIIPLKETRQYQVDIQRKEEQQVKSAKRKNTLPYLLENSLIKEGDRIYLKRNLPSYVTYDEKDATFHATITGKIGQSAVRWDKDGKEFAISALTWEIFKAKHPEGKNPGGTNGNWYWCLDSDETLWDVAEKHFRGKPGK